MAFIFTWLFVIVSIGVGIGIGVGIECISYYMSLLYWGFFI